VLIYHPAFDAYHCVFRMLVISGAVPALELAKLRILDYYMCFPAEVALIQLPQEHMEIRKVAKTIKNEYRGPVSAHRTFREMEPIQHAAARLLAASGVFDSRQLELGTVSRTKSALPDVLLQAAALEPATAGPAAAVSSYVLYKLSSLPLSGPGGLKQRTGLMEHRYDVA
jgi:hypothetical protein